MVNRLKNTRKKVAAKHSLILLGVQESDDETSSGLRQLLIDIIRNVTDSTINENELGECYRKGEKEANLSRPVVISYISENLEKEILTNAIKLRKKGLSIGWETPRRKRQIQPRIPDPIPNPNPNPNPFRPRITTKRRPSSPDLPIIH